MPYRGGIRGDYGLLRVQIKRCDLAPAGSGISSTKPQDAPWARDCSSGEEALAYLDKAVARRDNQGLQPRVHVEFVENVHHVSAFRLHCDVEPLGDLLAL